MRASTRISISTLMQISTSQSAGPPARRERRHHRRRGSPSLPVSQPRSRHQRRRKPLPKKPPRRRAPLLHARVPVPRKKRERRLGRRPERRPERRRERSPQRKLLARAHEKRREKAPSAGGSRSEPLLRKDHRQHRVGREHAAIVVAALGHDLNRVLRAQLLVDVLHEGLPAGTPRGSLCHRRAR